MLIAALIVAVLVALVWLGARSRRSGGRALGRDRRAAAGVAGVALIAAAAALAMRGLWPFAIGLASLGGWALLYARAAGTPPPGRPPAASREAMSADEARRILGVGADAGPEAVREAHRRLMMRAHPDQGGTEGLAAQLNAARERLLDGR